VRLVLDDGLAELFSGGRAGAVGIAPVAGSMPIMVSSPGGSGQIEGLTVFVMQRG
jgi:hypothetical protein